MTTRIKICGITRPEDALAAANCGADAIGLVFAPLSRRCVDTARAKEILRELPSGVSVIALFLDPDRDAVEQVLQQIEPDLLQFHGHESVKFCSRFGVPYIKTIGVGHDAKGNVPDINAFIEEYADAAALLFDSHAHGAAGGTGQRSDWRSLPRMDGRAVVLAGGLTPDNVADAMRIVRPYAVDVSSGVEDAPGVKSPEKMQAFIDEVRRADAVTS